MYNDNRWIAQLLLTFEEELTQPGFHSIEYPIASRFSQRDFSSRSPFLAFRWESVD